MRYGLQSDVRNAEPRPPAPHASGQAALTNDPGPLFLVGMPRSGTKLLRDLLNQHSRIAIPDIETEFLPYLAHRLERLGEAADPAAFSALYAQLVRLNYFDFRRLQGEIISEQRWFGACRSFGAAGVFEALIRQEVAAPPGSGIVWGDKSPGYIDDIPLISGLYPQARVLHIVRDVRDYCLSIHRAWGKDMLRAAERWSDGLSQARRDGRVLGARYLEIRYEDLLTDTEATLRQICGFLGLAFEPAMLTLSRPSENLGSTRGVASVVAHNSGKYLQQMAVRELLAVEAIAGETLVACGYGLTHELQPRRRLTTRERLWAQFKDAVNLVRSDTERLGVLGTIWFHMKYYRTTRG